MEQPEGHFEFILEELPGLTITGVIHKEDSKDILYITEVRLFSNWENGWTEGFYGASGKYKIEDKDDGYLLTTIDPFELWDIISGEIRYNDTYYRADNGLWKVKNRIDRLIELSRVIINDFNYDPSVDSLKDDIIPILFPEVYKFSRLEEDKILPKAYYDSDLEEEYTLGNGIKWRKDYTKSVYPEHLWELRDSGTLYRDCLEAPRIFETLFKINNIFIATKGGEIKI